MLLSGGSRAPRGVLPEHHTNDAFKDGDETKVNPMRHAAYALALGVALAATALPARAELTEEELAKLAQNPVGNLISVPFQNNAVGNLGVLRVAL